MKQLLDLAPISKIHLITGSFFMTGEIDRYMSRRNKYEHLKLLQALKY